MSDEHRWDFSRGRNEEDEVRREHRTGCVLRHDDVGITEGFAYRKGQILVAAAHVKLVEHELRSNGAHPVEEANGVIRYELDTNRDIPTLVARLRTPHDGIVPNVGPNHVLSGTGTIMGGPSTFAEPVDPPELCERGAQGEGVTIAVMDTGIALDASGDPEDTFLVGHVNYQLSDADELKRFPDDPFLGYEAGHGTFIAGVIREVAPGATIAIQRVLDSDGICDDFALAKALFEVYLRVQPHIINLSLGGYTFDDVPPISIAAALAQVGPETVVVAAAGNHGTDRPFFPAAMKGVIAVGALSGGATPAPLITNFEPEQAGYSNFGPWVDACAPGDWISSYVYYDDPTQPVPGFPPPEPPTDLMLPRRNFEGWARWAGTSFATPCVAAAIASLMTQEGIDAPAAAFRLVGAGDLRRLPGLGAVVDPPCLEAPRT